MTSRMNMSIMRRIDERSWTCITQVSVVYRSFISNRKDPTVMRSVFRIGRFAATWLNDDYYLSMLQTIVVY